MRRVQIRVNPERRHFPLILAKSTTGGALLTRKSISLGIYYQEIWNRYPIGRLANIGSWNKAHMGWLSNFAEWLGSLAGSVGGALMPAAKQRYAERQAGRAPEAVARSVSDELLDAAIVRLGAAQPGDPMWKRALVGAESALVRPEHFSRPSIREWLTRPQVRELLKTATEARVTRSATPEGVLQQLAAEYADATGDDSRLAEASVQVALASLQASVQSSVQDPGTATLVQAGVSAIRRQVDEGMSTLAEVATLSRNVHVSQRFTQDASKELEGILRRRASSGLQTEAELRALIREFDTGCKFAAADLSVQHTARYWLARVEAGAGKADEADRLLSGLAQQGFDVPKLAWAFVDLARGRPDDALRLIRDETDAESRSAVFHIILKSKGIAQALSYVDGLGELAPESLTAVGWNNVCVMMLSEGRVADACAALSRLPAEVLSQCTHLYFMYAVSCLMPMVPEDRRSSLMEAGFLAVAEHALDGPEATRARAAALDATDRALQCANEWGDKAIAERCIEGARVLRLIDPASRAEELARVQEAMKDGKSAVRFVWTARAFAIKFDSGPLESHLAQAQALGGLDEQQLRAKLYLLNVPERSSELVTFLDEEWAKLLPNNKPEALVAMKVQALVAQRDVEGARAFLEENAQILGGTIASRLRLMLQDARGEDPCAAAIALYHSSNAIEDLHNIVGILESRKQWRRLSPYAAELFRREPNFDSAMLRAKCLQRSRASARELRDFLESSVALVDQRPDMRSVRAWAHFEAGDHLAAKRLNDELLAQRDEVADIALDFNIAMRTGDWERFRDVAAKAWEKRAQLNCTMLLTLAKLVSLSDPTRGLALAQEAVEREGDNPVILVGAQAIAIAAQRDDLAMQWVHKAAQISKAGGPVSAYTYQEMVEFMRQNNESWKQKNEMYRTAQVPLHLAASLFNAPLSQLMISVPRQNEREADGRRRNPVPIRSGGRLRMPSQPFNCIALDITSLFILGELGLLEAVFDSFAEILVSPRVMDVLLEDRARVAFHQPSRIADVKPLAAMLAAGQLKVVQAAGERQLAAEAGDEAASLIAAANAQGGRYVHPGPLFKVSSFMENEADLGQLSGVLADPIAVANALRSEGIVTPAVCEEGISVLQRTTAAVARAPVAAAAPLFLDGLAVQYLQQAKLLRPLLNSGHPVWIHKSTVDEWNALLATEPMTAELTEAIDAIRLPLRAGLMSGKVRFLAQSRRQRDKLDATALLPMIDLLEDTDQIEAAVVDDRMLGLNAFMTDAKGKTIPVISTLDLFDRLVDEQRLSAEARRELVHRMRARCYFCIPIDHDDLLAYLGEAAVEEGQVRETAQLRVIRQYLSRLNSSDVLCTAADLAYQDALGRCGTLAIAGIWSDAHLPVEDAAVKADWIAANVIPDPELASRFADGAKERAEEVVAAQLSSCLLLPITDRRRRRAYAEWLDRSRLASFKPANESVLELVTDQAAALVLRQTEEAAIEIGTRNRASAAE